MSSSGASASASAALGLRVREPDVFHSMVKMHLSFLLDLNTDDCDCSFVMDSVATPTASAHGHAPKCDKEGSSLAKRLFTPKKFLGSSSSSAASSSSSASGVMDGAALTMEGVCQVLQLIEFLGREPNLSTEGVFRKHGNLKKQQALKERLNRGVTINLDDGEFTVHECAAVLKSFLSELQEPLLTDACYRAHCQVARMPQEQAEKRTACLQLLFLLVPEPNYNLLKDLLALLHRVSTRAEANKMPATNLGTMFAPLVLCPRKLSAETLQSNHQLLTKAVASMVEEAPSLFSLPARLQTDIEMYMKNKENQAVSRTPSVVPKADLHGKPQSPVVNTVYSFVDREKTSQVAAQSSTEAALAALYAHVQSMPESAQKRKMVAKLNDANGQGTPGVQRHGARKRSEKGLKMKSLLTPKRSNSHHAAGSSSSSTASRQDDRIGRHASYNLPQVGEFKTPADGGGGGKTPSQLLHSFRRQKSESAGDNEQKQQQKRQDLLSTAAAPEQQKDKNSQKLLSPQSSPALLVSPSAIDNIVGKAAATEQKKEDEEEESSSSELDGSYVAPPTATSSAIKKKRSAAPPPVPERVSSLQQHAISSSSASARRESEDGAISSAATAVTDTVSPISSYTKSMPSDMQKSMMTPRSRRPVHATTLPLSPLAAPAEGPFLRPFAPASSAAVPESPCVLSKYNEDEPEEEESKRIKQDDDEDDRETASMSDSERKAKNRAYTSRSLKSDFQAYLRENEMSLDTSTTTQQADTTAASSSSASVLEASVTSSVVAREADKLLSGEVDLSESMRAFMDGELADADQSSSSKKEAADKSSSAEVPVTPSVLTPVDVDSYLSDITEEGADGNNDSNKENNDSSYVSAKSQLSTYSTASTLPATAAATAANSPQNIPLPTFVAKDTSVATSSITISFPNNAAAATAAKPSPSTSSSSKSRKRRSLTEISELNPMASRGKASSSPAPNIFFETDL